MGKESKRRGKSFEYRVRNFFLDRSWEAIVVPLSGASQTITEEVGGHDVRASFPAEKSKITLTLECKKTGSKQRFTLCRKWLEGLDNEEILVFALHRTNLFVVLDLSYYCSVFGNVFSDGLFFYRELKFTRSHRLEMSTVLSAEKSPLLFLWNGRAYVITLLELLVAQLEKSAA